MAGLISAVTVSDLQQAQTTQRGLPSVRGCGIFQNERLPVMELFTSTVTADNFGLGQGTVWLVLNINLPFKRPFSSYISF